MATKFANIKGITDIEPSSTPPVGGVAGIALISFDLVGGQSYVGGVDTIQLGSSASNQAYENGVLSVASALTLQQMIQNRRRDGRTVTLLSATPADNSGLQSKQTFWAGGVALAGTSNVSANLFTAFGGSTSASTTSAAWDRAASILVNYSAA